jgi:hypothetical protein
MREWAKGRLVEKVNRPVHPRLDLIVFTNSSSRITAHIDQVRIHPFTIHSSPFTFHCSYAFCLFWLPFLLPLPVAASGCRFAKPNCCMVQYCRIKELRNSGIEELRN